MRRANLIVRKKRAIATPVLATTLAIACTILVYNRPVTRSVPVQRKLAQVTTPAATKVVVKTVAKTDEFSELEKKFKAQTIVGMESLEREKNSKAIRITLNSDVFFQLGTAKIEEASKESIAQILDILKPISARSVIEIEGHTDDSPVIHQKPNYPSNWELSAARAASFIPYFSSNGFFKDQLKVIGYGDSHPLFSNHITNKISAKNRRIVLRISAQEDERKI